MLLQISDYVSLHPFEEGSYPYTHLEDATIKAQSCKVTCLMSQDRLVVEPSVQPQSA